MPEIRVCSDCLSENLEIKGYATKFFVCKDCGFNKTMLIEKKNKGLLQEARTWSPEYYKNTKRRTAMNSTKFFSLCFGMCLGASIWMQIFQNVFASQEFLLLAIIFQNFMIEESKNK